MTPLDRMVDNIEKLTVWIMDLKNENKSLTEENERLKDEIQMLLNELNK